jgi:hypothetical protein
MTKKLLILVILLFVSIPAFAQSVDTAWVRRYNTPGDYTDYAYAITVDDSGNVYVTGAGSGEYVTIRYYPNGDTSWVKREPGANDRASAIALDGSNNVFVTGKGWTSWPSYSYDYVTIKYQPNGTVAWESRYNGPAGGEDDASAIVIDRSDNIYVTGKSWGGDSYFDFATVKYFPNGDTAWARRYNGPANSTDWTYAIAVDDSNNVYVTGGSIGSESAFDYATIKYYPSGDTAWVRRYDGPSNGDDESQAIVVDDSGNVYVTGYSDGGWPSAKDYATIKYHPNGDTAWVRRYNLPNDDKAYAIAVDGSGNVYVTGYSWGTYEDYTTIKYYPNGDTAWVKRYNGSPSSSDEASAIALDGYGNIYVTGKSENDSPNHDYDYATVKYDTWGNELWAQRYNGPPSFADEATAITVDGSGNIYVTGYSNGAEISYDYATIKYVQFLRGDVNRDGAVDVVDAVYLISYLYINGLSPIPILQVGDVNCNRVVDLGDVVYLISYVYRGGPAPCN